MTRYYIKLDIAVIDDTIMRRINIANIEQYAYMIVCQDFEIFCQDLIAIYLYIYIYIYYRYSSIDITSYWNQKNFYFIID